MDWEQATVVTKVDDIEPPPAGCSEQEAEKHFRRAVDSSVFQSCRELRRFYLPVVLAGHSLQAYRNKALWGRLLELQADGVINKLGVSCCGPNDALAALADPHVEHIQIPFNVLDWRWRDGRVQRRLQERPEVRVHARSIFLQGLLLSTEGVYPEMDGMDPRLIINTLDRLARQLGCNSRKQLALAYCLAERHWWIETFLLGIVTVAQLKDNLADIEVRGHLSEDECRIVDAEVGCLQESGCLPESLLNPHLWPRKKTVRRSVPLVPEDMAEKRQSRLEPGTERDTRCTCLALNNTVACICAPPQHNTDQRQSDPDKGVVYAGRNRQTSAGAPAFTGRTQEASLAELVADAELDFYQVGRSHICPNTECT